MDNQYVGTELWVTFQTPTSYKVGVIRDGETEWTDAQPTS